MLTMKEINAKITGVKRSTAAIRENIQVILCNSAGHAFEHGDVTAFTRLFDAASGLNRKLIVKWAQEYGFAVFQKDGTFKLNKSARNKVDFGSGEQVVEYLTADARLWYVNEETASDIERELNVANRLKSLTKQIKNPKDGTKVVLNASEIKEAMAELREALVDIHTENVNARAAEERAKYEADQKSPLTPEEEAAEEAAEAAAAAQRAAVDTTYAAAIAAE